MLRALACVDQSLVALIGCTVRTVVNLPLADDRSPRVHVVGNGTLPAQQQQQQQQRAAEANV